MTRLMLLLENSERVTTGLNMIVSGDASPTLCSLHACARLSLPVAIVRTITILMSRDHWLSQLILFIERRDGKKNFKIIFLKNHENFKLKKMRYKFIFKIKKIWIPLKNFQPLLNSLLFRYYKIYEVWWNVVIEL